jgi:hypothetical protein
MGQSQEMPQSGDGGPLQYGPGGSDAPRLVGGCDAGVAAAAVHRGTAEHTADRGPVAPTGRDARGPNGVGRGSGPGPPPTSGFPDRLFRPRRGEKSGYSTFTYR